MRSVMDWHAPPPPSMAKETPSSLVHMGFPSYGGHGGGHDGEVSFTGANSDLTKGKSFTCPRCKSRIKDLPQACHVCGLSLVSSAHLARSYHHLFPVPLFAEEQVVDCAEELKSPFETGVLSRCGGCGVSVFGGNGMKLVCPKCKTGFCITCDVYIHEELHNCPGCCDVEQQQQLGGGKGT